MNALSQTFCYVRNVRLDRLTVVAVGIALVGAGLFVAPPASSDPGASTRFEHFFRIDSEHIKAGPIDLGAVRNVARGAYAVDVRADGQYAIHGGMRGTHVGYKTKLSFRTEGRMDGNAWMPTRYVARVEHDSVLAEDRTRETTIDFDVAHGKAYARATSEKDGRRRVLYDTRPAGTAIDRGVKDPISGLMDILTADLSGEARIRTVVGGAVVQYRVRDLGRQNVNVQGAQVACRVRSLSIPAGAIDSNPYVFTLWSRQGNGRHVLRARIAPAGSSLIARYDRTGR